MTEPASRFREANEAFVEWGDLATLFQVLFPGIEWLTCDGGEMSALGDHNKRRNSRPSRMLVDDCGLEGEFQELFAEFSEHLPANRINKDSPRKRALVAEVHLRMP